MSLDKERKKSEHKEESISWLSEEARASIWAVIVLAFSVVFALSLLDAAGTLGMWVKSALEALVGWGAWVVPALLILVVYLVIIGKQAHRRAYHTWGLIVVLLSLVGLFHSLIPLESAWPAVGDGRGGGYLGFAMSFPFRRLMGSLASTIFLLALTGIGTVLLFNTPLTSFLRPWEIWRRIKGLKQLPQGGVIGPGEDKKQGNEKPFLHTALPLAKAGIHIKAGAAEAPARVRLPKIDIPLDLLERADIHPQSGDIRKNCEIIKSTLETFGIQVEMKDVHVGPTVTQYTLKPSEGVKLSQITALQNDLALALAALSIRVEAPIPGKALVGIEIPNKSVATVPLRNVLESSEFSRRKSQLTITIGQDVAGNAFIADLTKMPHLLVAGATGSGKSVCINTALISLLYQNSPEDMRLILVDPKRVELTMYNGIPHLLTPVIVDVQKTINALKWTVSEMERRYEVLSEKGKRNIESFNQSCGSEDKLAYIIVVIDELADIMAVAARDVEAMIIRLAQMARAVGIHLVLATQRPSVNVITGLIKANITTRIAFSVASGVDSRTIIDSSGAEKLLGRGDMLFISSELSKPKRAQGAYVAEEEVKRVVDFLKQKAQPQYVEAVVQKHGGTSASGMVGMGDDYDDVLYQEARHLVIETGKASASLLQRRLRVGYARAARLLDLLEEQGIVGPQEGARPREVFVASGGSEGFDVAEDQNFDTRDDERMRDDYV
ncbi:MAG TPA: DNA translocase FtsK 4TM domain-containing protein [Patescibacteria group bacterium]|nr:DNA translocase FtsK 4TM domain-containing protein [Patescibacteria group bacterium]